MHFVATEGFYRTRQMHHTGIAASKGLISESELRQSEHKNLGTVGCLQSSLVACKVTHDSYTRYIDC